MATKDDKPTDSNEILKALSDRLGAGNLGSGLHGMRFVMKPPPSRKTSLWQFGLIPSECDPLALSVVIPEGARLVTPNRLLVSPGAVPVEMRYLEAVSGRTAGDVVGREEEMRGWRPLTDRDEQGHFLGKEEVVEGVYDLAQHCVLPLLRPGDRIGVRFDGKVSPVAAALTGNSWAADSEMQAAEVALESAHTVVPGESCDITSPPIEHPTRFEYLWVSGDLATKSRFIVEQIYVGSYGQLVPGGVSAAMLTTWPIGRNMESVSVGKEVRIVVKLAAKAPPTAFRCKFVGVSVP